MAPPRLTTKTVAQDEAGRQGLGVAAPLFKPLPFSARERALDISEKQYHPSAFPGKRLSTPQRRDTAAFMASTV